MVPRFHPMWALLYVLCLLLVTCSMCADAVPRRIVKMAFMHRHGARTGPIVLPNGQLDFNEAVLTDVGVRMASALGLFLRRHYSNLTAMNDRSAYYSDYTLFCNDGYNGPLPCINGTYDPRVLVSESTAFERTLRTGVGVVRGMFMQYNATLGDYATDELVVPYLPAPPAALDMKLGFYYSWPSAILHTPGPIALYNADHNNDTLNLISQKQVDAMGAALFAGTSASNQCATAQTLCVLAAQDIVSCAYSNRPNSTINATLIELWPRFMEAQEYSNAFLYMNWGNRSTVNKHDMEVGNTSLLNSTSIEDRQVDYWSGAGPYGRVYAQSTIARFRTALADIEANVTTDPSLVYHSSAHDVTIYGFLVAVGAIRIANYLTGPLRRDPTFNFDPRSQSAYLLVPRFASLAVLELYSDGNVSIGMATGPQRYYDNTSLEEEYVLTEHYAKYQWATPGNVLLGCTSVHGRVTYASECSLDDLARTVESMGPLVPVGPQTDNDAPRPPLPNNFNIVSNFSPSGVLATASRLFVSDEPLGEAQDFSYCFRLPADEVITSCQGNSNNVPTSDVSFSALLGTLSEPSSLPLTRELQTVAKQLLDLRRFQGSFRHNGTIERYLSDVVSNKKPQGSSLGVLQQNQHEVAALRDAMNSNFCFAYRRTCPQFACMAPHYVLNLSNYACVWVYSTEGGSYEEDDLGFFSSRHGIWFYVGTASGSVLIGGVVGFIVAIAAAERRARTDAREAGLINDERDSQRSRRTKSGTKSGDSHTSSGSSGKFSNLNAADDRARVRAFHKKPKKSERSPLIPGRSRVGSGGTPVSSLSPHLLPSSAAFRPTLPIVDYGSTPPAGTSQMGSQLRTAPTSPAPPPEKKQSG